MPVARMDLADKGSPEGLVSLILKHELNLPIPVPIEALSRQLDIEDICALETEGFEGGLLTDTARSRGIILVKEGISRQRRRFTIGHELGHFLMPTHVPDTVGRFLCSRQDMMRLSAKENDRRAKMELEANKFSSLILIPPPALRNALDRHDSPSIEHLFTLADRFDVSKEAMARAYANYHSEAVAFVVVHEGKVLRTHSNKIRFPFITVSRGKAVPAGSLFYRNGHKPGQPSEIDTRLPDHWIDVERGRPAPTVSEQVCLQSKGFALIMLWHEPAENDQTDEDSDRTAKDRWKERKARFADR
jgi:Zn-dependent peptidase ImmA (M78 family)